MNGSRSSTPGIIRGVEKMALADMDLLVRRIHPYLDGALPNFAELSPAQQDFRKFKEYVRQSEPAHLFPRSPMEPDPAELHG